MRRHADHEVRARFRRVGQRGEVGHVAVLGAQVLDVAEFQGAQGARLDANGLQARRHARRAAVALDALALLLVDARGVVGASRDAGAAADAGLFVPRHKARVGVLADGALRASSQACGVIAMVACDGNVVGEDRVAPQAARLVLCPCTAGILHDVAQGYVGA